MEKRCDITGEQATHTIQVVVDGVAMDAHLCREQHDAVMDLFHELRLSDGRPSEQVQADIKAFNAKLAKAVKARS
jgi:hypothetical protein